MKKHNPRIFNNKKGAIELSMSTIIVVIIGVTLLTLGIRWVYNIFGDIEGSRQQMSDAMKKQIMEMFGESEEPLNLLQTYTEIEQGKSYDLGVAIKNTLSEKHTLQYEIQVTKTPNGVKESDVEEWFIGGQGVRYELDSGETQPDHVIIKIPRSNAPLGTYRIEVNLDCTNCEISETRSFVFEVI